MSARTPKAARTVYDAGQPNGAKFPARNADHQALVKACQDYLDAIGAWRFKVLGGIGQRAGVPDCLACVPERGHILDVRRFSGRPPGRFVGIECKTGTGRLTAAQVAERDAIIAAGGLFVEVRRIEDLEAALLGAGLIGGRMLNR